MVVAAALVLTLRRPALPVLTLGVVLVGLRRSPWRDVRQAANPAVLSGLFGLAVLLGTLARISDWPEDVVDHSGRWAVAAVAAGLAVLVNNLPASVLLASHAPSHPRALLIGLNIGPSLFVTGSLSAFLWLRAAHAVGAHPSIRTYARIGIVLVPLSIGAALAALGFLASVRL